MSGNALVGLNRRRHWPSPRRLIGAGILATVIGITGIQTWTTQEIRAQSVTVAFGRGDRMADGTDIALDRVASVLKSSQTAHAVITGYVEPGSDPDADLRLSQRRADVVKDAMVSAGVDVARITTRGVGGSQPLAHRDGEADAAWARRQSRVDIKVSER